VTVELLASATQYEKLLDHVDEGAVILDGNGRVAWANKAAAMLLGSATDLVGDKLRAWLTDPNAFDQMLVDHREQEYRQQLVTSAVAMSGAKILMAVPARRCEEPCIVIIKPLNFAAIDFDWLTGLATRDNITSLGNREAFLAALHAGVARAERITVICISIDQFSTINDVYGHAEGDRVLRVVAHRLRIALGPTLPLARIYGARFAVMLCDCKSRCEHTGACGRWNLETALQAVCDALLGSIPIGGRDHAITASIGFATSPESVTPAELLSSAETAVRIAADSGGGRVLEFEPSMMRERRDVLQIETDLRRAIETNQLTLVYQPKVRWSDGALIGFEALARWNHPVRGPIAPSVFVPVAEKCGLTAQLGRWAINEASRQVAEWRNRGLAPVSVAVNLSPRHVLTQPIDEVLAPVAAAGVPRQFIEIEITESALMDQLATTPGLIESLRDSAVQISIDDFGTGHSSLANLRRLPIHTLKIDRSFVEDIDKSGEAYDIVATIVAMARSLSLEVVAEGVETRAQGILLDRLGVSTMQGYLFSRPVPAEQAAGLMHDSRPYLAISAA
jgi:diguanylate cyclase (GGDEF)-like protein